jgi:hypothetical protein
VLEAIGCPPEALDYHGRGADVYGLPVDWTAARQAAEWVLTPQRVARQLSIDHVFCVLADAESKADRVLIESYAS